jgi:hypothetical protein
MRLRQAFGEYENNAWGLHVTAGQAWSLVTTDKVGMNPLSENIPMVIDSSYLPGFNFTRAPEIRITKDFDDKKLWVGISAENPQAETNGACTSTSNPSNSPSLGANACANYNSSYQVSNSTPYTSDYAGSLSTDVAPDVVAKVSYDPGFGHYEIFGLTRFFHDTTGTSYHNNYTMGAGGGAAAVLPVVPKYVDVQANMMAGQGIGRYGAAQLPDFAISPDGSIKPIREYTAMFGVVGHPVTALDTYLYAGMEQEFREQAYGNLTTDSFGYGNANINNTGCNIGNSVTGTGCFAQTSSVWQVTPGFWYRAYDGNYGKAQVGVQDAWTRRNTFTTNNGINPHSIDNTVMVSFRYYPF